MYGLFHFIVAPVVVFSLQDKMKNDDAHSKALELEHVMFENERLQADIEKMEKVFQSFFITRIFPSATFIQFADLRNFPI